MNLIFDKFNKSGIDYCILRSMKKGSDIDVLIYKKDYLKIRTIFLKNGYVEVPKEKHSKLFRKMTDEGIADFHVHIGGLDYCNIIYYPAKKVLPNKIRMKNYFIPDKKTYLECLELHQIIDRNRNGIKPKIKLVLKNIHNPMELARLKFCLIKHRMRRKRKIVINFIGCNGTGKSTQCELLCNYLNKNGISARVLKLGCYHGRSKFGKILDRLYSKTNTKSNQANLDYRFKQKSILKNLFRLWDIKERYRTDKGNSQVLIIDRGFLDILLYGQLDKFSAFLLHYFLPQPDFIFYLSGDPNILKERRNENSALAMKEQDEQLEKGLDQLGIIYTKINTTLQNEQESLKKVIGNLNNWRFFRKL